MEIIPSVRAPREERAAAFKARKVKKSWPKYEDYLESWEWRQSRDAALRRAKWKCERCQSKRSLQVHHKSYERLGEELPEDLEVLCGPCHEGHHVEEWFQVAQIYTAVVSGCLAREKFATLADLLEAVKVACATKKIPYDGQKVWKAVRLVNANRGGVLDIKGVPKPRPEDLVDVTDSRPVTHKEAVAFVQQYGFDVNRWAMEPPITHSKERTTQQIEDWRSESRNTRNRPAPPVVVEWWAFQCAGADRRVEARTGAAMRGKALKDRRSKAAELARREVDARCAVCRVDLGTVPAIVEDFLVRGKCCSDECLNELIARAAKESSGPKEMP